VRADAADPGDDQRLARAEQTVRAGEDGNRPRAVAREDRLEPRGNLVHPRLAGNLLKAPVAGLAERASQPLGMLVLRDQLAAFHAEITFRDRMRPVAAHRERAILADVHFDPADRVTETTEALVSFHRRDVTTIPWTSS